MNISGAFGKYGTAGIQGGALPGRGQREAGLPSSSYSGFVDKVSISQRAKINPSLFQPGQKKAPNESGDLGELTFVGRALEDWHKKYFEEGNRSPDQNSEAWLPENREQLQAIWAEMEAIVAVEPDTITRSEAANKKLNDLTAQRTVLEVFGQSMIVTDEAMAAGVTAFQAAEERYAESEMNKHQQDGASLVKAYLSGMLSRNSKGIEETCGQFKIL